MAAKKGDGLLMVYSEVPERHEEEYNAWYDTEHIPERLSIPGVLHRVVFGDGVTEKAVERCLTRAMQGGLLRSYPLHFRRHDMLHISNFNGVARIITGIAATNATMLTSIRKQALSQSDLEATAHLANALASALD